ncbi:hypothetical protein COCHEDRAFT_1204717 [Bipolaris maydis C5]|uniref:E3 UFM1-protein ligase-like C-terminal domain-containing protein n=1 Tax=Cochliobolus heterostrophus (strain C5 / ATCC 48332 / race O) TaxID=701091 RepID=M2U8K4_COCH5|nr:hypothetical protein COCHEDRAFT_1204717 [Bipolaris maydis C5]KAJ6207927.1 hypothetical protein PSV09DRAFT_1204717 [Bipolaris maydis]KAJ6269445.1 hypothetical protein PSV08DRAFT_204420 [Bipolaris maydis]KAJ6280737.1 hypothetical protein J3E71DRAFT_392854 [Bipolaris maydis]
MFTENDVKSIFSLFPPQTSAEFIPQFALASSGNGFVTLQFAQAQFRSRVTRETERISISELASDLDISTILVHQLARSHPKLCLLSADQENIIPIDERDALEQKLADLLSSGVHSKTDFASQHDIWPQSLDALLADQTHDIVDINGFVCTGAYESEISSNITSRVKQALDQPQLLTLQRTITILPEDLHGSPPAWFIFRTLEKALDSESLTSQVTIEQDPNRVICTPKKLVESKRNATVEELKSGTLEYLDLRQFAADYSELIPTFEDAVSYFQNIEEVDVLDSFAVSKRWIARLEQDSVRILVQEGSTLDVTQLIGPGLPATIMDPIVAKVKDSVVDAFSQRPQEERIVRVGHLILTGARRTCALDELSSYAKADVESQWQLLHADPTRTDDIKFSRDRIRASIPKLCLVQRFLADEKPVEKLLEETFLQTLASLETPNEADFATYWTDRILARFQVYKTGLSHVADQKLHDQLADLLASYAHKDLIPDTIAKARAQGLVLSRKTRKNIARLSSILDTAKTMDISAITSALDKFAKKQGISAPAPASLENAKQSMVDDMLRRLQKQKASDGPVLFLMLVIVLFARHYNGVVYATGKFAPKLLKLLKGKMGEEQYEQVEKWKEAAKASSLSAEDQAEMVKMAKTKDVIVEG